MYSLEFFSRRTGARSCRQGGLSLVEVLVGQFIGLLIIAATLGILLATRMTSEVVSEMTHLQQQASFAMRVMGMQIRQTASTDIARQDALGLYVFRQSEGVDGSGLSVSGTDDAGNGMPQFHVDHAVAKEISSQFSDCLGDALGEELDSLTSKFSIKGNELRCWSSKSPNQGARALVRNVAALEVHYRVTQGEGTRRMSASETEAGTLWPRVRAVEVCLHLVSDTKSPDTVAGTYRGCDGKDRPLDGYLHLVTHNVFTLRAQEE